MIFVVILAVIAIVLTLINYSHLRILRDGLDELEKSYDDFVNISADCECETHKQIKYAIISIDQIKEDLSRKPEKKERVVKKKKTKGKLKDSEVRKAVKEVIAEREASKVKK